MFELNRQIDMFQTAANFLTCELSAFVPLRKSQPSRSRRSTSMRSWMSARGDTRRAIVAPPEPQLGTAMAAASAKDRRSEHEVDAFCVNTASK